MEANLLSVSKTARVITSGDKTASVAIVALHGYAQLSERFLEKIAGMSDVYWVVPEALHRFYIEGFSGIVGASWMTKELRDADIVDTTNYLNEVFSRFIVGKEFDKVVLLGFSQGGATAIRFSHAFSHYIDALIVWGSDFPKEVILDFKEVTSQVKKYFVLGDQDPFFEFNLQDRVKEQMRLLGFESVSYEGKHKVEQEILDTIIAKIRNGEN